MAGCWIAGKPLAKLWTLPCFATIYKTKATVVNNQNTVDDIADLTSVLLAATLVMQSVYR